MAINITKLISAVSGIVGNLDSDNTLTELNRGTIAAQEVNEARDALSFATVADFETADSTNEGNIVYANSTKQYYVSIHNRWAPITLTGPSTTAPAAPSYPALPASPEQGSTYGYTILGPITQNVYRYPFSSETDAASPWANTGTGHGNGAAVGDVGNGNSYWMAGYPNAGGAPPNPTYSPYHAVPLGTTSAVDKLAYSSGTNSIAGAFPIAKRLGTATGSTTYGYSHGGFPATNVTTRFPYSSPWTTSTVMPTLTTPAPYYFASATSSAAAGYIVGGVISLTNSNEIAKFPFSSEDDFYDVGDLTRTTGQAATLASSDNGYSLGGNSQSTTMDKFPFASDTNATDIADLQHGMINGGTVSSPGTGYTMGAYGFNPADPVPGPATFLNTVIQKFPFASDANATAISHMPTGIGGNTSGMGVASS